MADSKLKNIKALTEMLDGSHRTQNKTSVGFSDTDNARSKKREVGETWEEKNIHGNIEYITQKEGYRIRSNVSPEMSEMLQKIRDDQRKFPNCQKEECTCKAPTSLDQRFRRIVGMCEDCLITMETRLKIQGKFNEYALDKMKANAEAFFAQADKEVDVLKESIKDVSFVNSEHGDVEKWDSTNTEELLEKIDDNYKSFKDRTMSRFTTI